MVENIGINKETRRLLSKAAEFSKRMEISFEDAYCKLCANSLHPTLVVPFGALPIDLRAGLVEHRAAGNVQQGVAGETFEMVVQRLRTEGAGPGEAVRLAIGKYPALHEGYLSRIASGAPGKLSSKGEIK